MEIIYIVNARIPTEKAHGYQICKMCEEFVSAGANIELWIPNRNNPIKEDLFYFYSLKRNFTIKKIGFFDGFRFQKYLGERFSFYLQSFVFFTILFFKNISRNTIIYSRNPEIIWLFRLKRHKTFYDAHIWPENKNFVFKLFLHKVKGVICNSKGTEKKFKKNGFKNTIVAYNAVEIEKFNIYQDKNQSRRELNLPLDKKIIMYAGNLFEWKGINVIINAAELADNQKKMFFVLVGGNETDKNKYSKIISQKSLKNITFTGYVKKGKIPFYLKTADVLILPNTSFTKESVYYTSPIKMFEYMASGAPIIASNLPSLTEILNEKNAVLVRPDSAVDMLLGINKVLTNLQFADKIKKQAYADVQKYTWRNRVKIIIDFFSSNL